MSGSRLRRDEETLLQEWSNGDPAALDELMLLVFDEVREMARRYFAHEAADHRLQPTALVKEVYLRLHGLHTVQWKNREHFFSSLAGMMRRILVDHARRRQSNKRGASGQKISLDEAILPAAVRPEEMVALDDALETLGQLDPRQHEIVKLKFFVGMTFEQIAEILGVSLNTVKRAWASARMWLLRELDRREEAHGGQGSDVPARRRPIDSSQAENEVVDHLERLRPRIEAALDRVARARAEAEKRRGQAPRPGQLFLITETIEHDEHSIRWVVLERDSDSGRVLVVPADLHPSVGSADVAIAADAAREALSLRCGFAVWVEARRLEPELRVGLLRTEDLERARRKHAEVVGGALTGSFAQRETDREPEYQDWLEDAVAPAQAALEEPRENEWAERAARWRRPARWAGGAALLAASALMLTIHGGWWPVDDGVPMATVEKVIGKTEHWNAIVAHPLLCGALLRAGDELVTSDEARVAIRLAGGASLRLDRATRLRFISGSVFALQAGAIYLDNRADEGVAGSFGIQTPWGLVTDIGTQFELRIVGDGLRIRVREGRALFDRRGRSLVVPVGFELIFDLAGGAELRKAPVHGPIWRWVLEVAPSYDYDGESVGNFLDWLAREGGWEVRFADAIVASKVEHTTIRGSIVGLMPVEALDIVLAASGLGYRLEDDVLFIVER